MGRKTLKNYLKNEIRMRYAEDSILDYDDNDALHRLFKNNGISTRTAENAKILNDNIIKLSESLLTNQETKAAGNPAAFEEPLFHTLLDQHNLRPTKEDFQKIRDKNIKLCVVGYGGAMINILYNMYLWAMELSETRIFDRIIVFDKDDIDFSNIPRIGKSIAFNYLPTLVMNTDSSFPEINTVKKVSLITVEKELSKQRKIITFSQWLQDEHVKTLNDKGYTMIGAPTLETRTMLRNNNADFYFIGHAGYEVEITYQPEITSGLTVETYGSIDIPVLLINLQLATAALIKQLASDEQPTSNQKLFDFDLKTEKEKL
jgi:hypothetical protein